MKSPAIIAVLFLFSITACLADFTGYSRTFSKEIDTNAFVQIYQINTEISSELYSCTFIMYPDKTYEPRNVIPPVKNVNIGNNNIILIDSCDFDMVYFTPDSINKERKYLSEFINPSNNQVIALEYGAMGENERYVLPDSSAAFYAVNSYFLTIADADQYASQYLPNEVTEIFAFSDSNNNTLFEIKYQDKIVGIKYYSAKNNQWFTKYFKPKV